MQITSKESQTTPMLKPKKNKRWIDFNSLGRAEQENKD
jgi:hypothetical protein